MLVYRLLSSVNFPQQGSILGLSVPVLIYLLIYFFQSQSLSVPPCLSPSVRQSLKRKGRPSRGSGRPGRRKLAGGRRRKRRRRGGRSTTLRWRRRRPRSSRGRRTRRRRGGTDRQQQVGAKHLAGASAGGVTGTFTFKS